LGREEEAKAAAERATELDKAAAVKPGPTTN
jgi:hypothetical protein